MRSGHMICDWPDLYDYGYDSEGVGNYDLMAGGSYNGSQKNPAVPNPYLLAKKGWGSYTDITNTANDTILTATACTFENRTAISSFKYDNVNNSGPIFYCRKLSKGGTTSQLPRRGFANLACG